MRNVLPANTVSESRSGTPVMALFDLLGRRWAMRVLWTLAEAGPCTFRELQHRCETISPGALNVRLKELRSSLLVEHAANGYAVLPRGRELYGLLLPMGTWSKSWAKDL
jgi:DNA-binding HxlR family transcriptional regulator